MNWKQLVTVSLLSGLGLFWPVAIGGQPTSNNNLEGVWKATRNFGPAIEGTLDIVHANEKWSAQIKQFDVPLTVKGDRLSLKLPGDEGRFEGRLEKDGASIRGHWIQPPTVNYGGNFNSPVVLRSLGRNHWRGEVIPLKDEWTLYLVVTRKPDGSLGAFIRNPDRNIGMFWYVDRLEQEGNRIKLIGKWLNRGQERVFGEGIHYPTENRLSIYFPNRGGTYDFVPLGDDLAPGFHASGKDPKPYEYHPPTAEGDGWKVGTLQDVGMRAEPIAEVVKTINATPTSLHDLDIHALLVARHGKLVVEEYFHGFHRMKPHDTRSASKSMAATLVGAAIQGGAKLDVSSRVYDVIYKGKLPQGIDPRKTEMTVEYLLTMSSGYNCNDWDSPRPGSEDVVTDEQPDRDYYRYTLQLPMEAKPGQRSTYCSIDPNLLGAVLSSATQRPVNELFQDLVAEPLQIHRYYLHVQPTGEPYLGGGMYFLPRDFMKFAQLMLDGGVWNGKRILSKEFVRRASTPLVTLQGQREGMKYGYLWWTRDYPYKGKTVQAYFASGNGGQIAMAIPELDLVIATHGGNYNDRGGWAMVREHIPKLLAAIKD